MPTKQLSEFDRIHDIPVKEPAQADSQASSLPGLAVGVDALRRTVDFTFDEPHALVAGVTGSGKSETLRTILYNLACPIARTPEEIARVLTFAHQSFLNRRTSNIRDDYRMVVVSDESNLALAQPRLMALVEQLAADPHPIH